MVRFRLGMNGVRIRKVLVGRCVKIMVWIRLMRLVMCTVISVDRVESSLV